jgi:CRP-like cAMP-binding protein
MRSSVAQKEHRNMNIEQEIERRLQTLIEEISALVRQRALEAIADALGTSPKRFAKPSGRVETGHASASAVAIPAGTSGGAATAATGFPVRKQGARRTAEQFAAIEKMLLSYVQSKPGQRMEEISRALGMTPAELARPARRLIARGALRTTGQKRATKYFPARAE